jgi:hypothetical protein
MVVEQHLERLLSPFWGLPPRPALVRASRALSMEFRPAFDETWGEKLSRTGRALRRALVPVASHNRQLGQSAVRGRRRNRPRGERGETD